MTSVLKLGLLITNGMNPKLSKSFKLNFSLSWRWQMTSMLIFTVFTELNIHIFAHVSLIKEVINNIEDIASWNHIMQHIRSESLQLHICGFMLLTTKLMFYNKRENFMWTKILQSHFSQVRHHLFCMFLCFCLLLRVVFVSSCIYYCPWNIIFDY